MQKKLIAIGKEDFKKFSQECYLAMSFRSSLPSLFLSNIFICSYRKGRIKTAVTENYILATLPQHDVPLPWYQYTLPASEVWWTSCAGGTDPVGNPEGRQELLSATTIVIQECACTLSCISHKVPLAHWLKCNHCYLCHRFSKSVMKKWR